MTDGHQHPVCVMLVGGGGVMPVRGEGGGGGMSEGAAQRAPPTGRLMLWHVRPLHEIMTKPSSGHRGSGGYVAFPKYARPACTPAKCFYDQDSAKSNGTARRGLFRACGAVLPQNGPPE